MVDVLAYHEENVSTGGRVIVNIGFTIVSTNRQDLHNGKRAREDKHDDKQSRWIQVWYHGEWLQ